jgi:PPOX class probable F420-dependent enzyme
MTTPKAAVNLVTGHCANRRGPRAHLLRQMPIPAALHGQKYISLATFRKTGVPVYTPIWFAEEGDRLYFMTGSKLGKVKRLRNNPQVKIAPCTIRGRITGPEFAATARILPLADAGRVQRAIKAKYWLARVPFLWRNTDTYVEIAVG